MSIEIGTKKEKTITLAKKPEADVPAGFIVVANDGSGGEIFDVVPIKKDEKKYKVPAETVAVYQKIYGA